MRIFVMSKNKTKDETKNKTNIKTNHGKVWWVALERMTPKQIRTKVRFGFTKRETGLTLEK